VIDALPLVAAFNAQERLFQSGLFRLAERISKGTMRSAELDPQRLILWSVVVRRKPLFSLLVEDCEAYKDFLEAPIASFTGPKRPRTSGRWRSLAPEGLSADSQAYFGAQHALHGLPAR
jgi:hypothetical protein